MSTGSIDRTVAVVDAVKASDRGDILRVALDRNGSPGLSSRRRRVVRGVGESGGQWMAYDPDRRARVYVRDLGGSGASGG